MMLLLHQTRTVLLPFFVASNKRSAAANHPDLLQHLRTDMIVRRQTHFTRPQIAALYELHRKRGFVGKEAEWRQLEVDLIRAGCAFCPCRLVSAPTSSG
jgi:hypothetical protein